MKKYFLNNKGSTLIEVIAVSAIIVIVFTAAGMFFVANLFSYKATNSNIFIENQGRSALNTIIKDLREQSKIEKVSFKDDIRSEEEQLKSSGKQSLSTIVFQGTEFRLDDNGTLFKKTIENGEINLCSNIQKISIEPLINNTLSKDKSYGACDGLNITLIMKLANSTINIESEAYFRN